MPVRELLALSTLFYFQLAPKDARAEPLLAMWGQVNCLPFCCACRFALPGCLLLSCAGARTAKLQ